MCRTPDPWEARHSTGTYHYKGQRLSLSESEYSVCRECGFDVVLPRQKRRNEARIRDEHRRVDGLLIGRQNRLPNSRCPINGGLDSGSWKC